MFPTVGIILGIILKVLRIDWDFAFTEFAINWGSMAFFYWIRSLNRWCSIDIVKLSVMSVMKRVYLLHVVSRAAFSRA